MNCTNYAGKFTRRSEQTWPGFSLRRHYPVQVLRVFSQYPTIKWGHP
jgi:hypothetical protein